MHLLAMIERQSVRMGNETRMVLGRLPSMTSSWWGLASGATQTLVPRGHQLLAAARGGFTLPSE